MPFSLSSNLRRYLAIAVVWGLVSACSSETLPSVSQAPASYSAWVIPAGGTVERLAVFAKGKCKNPQFPLICVKRGSVNSLGVRLTCHRGKKTIHCGKVTWVAKVDHHGLRATFSPDPGNPSTEMVTASSRVKPGDYYQTISWTCTGYPNCKTRDKWPITVLK